MALKINLHLHGLSEPGLLKHDAIRAHKYFRMVAADVVGVPTGSLDGLLRETLRAPDATGTYPCPWCHYTTEEGRLLPAVKKCVQVV